MRTFLRRILKYPSPPPSTQEELIERYVYLSGEYPPPDIVTDERLLRVILQRMEDIQSGRLHK